MRDKMPRHGKDYCMLCNPYGNGTSGEEGTEAIGWYYLPPGTSKNQDFSGEIPVCKWCAYTVETVGFEVKPIEGRHEDHEFFQERVGDESCNHDWEKESLVTEVGGYDKMKCLKCGAEGRKYDLGGGVIPEWEI